MPVGEIVQAVFVVCCGLGNAVLSGIVIGRFLRGDPVSKASLGLLAVCYVLLLVLAVGF